MIKSACVCFLGSSHLEQGRFALLILIFHIVPYTDNYLLVSKTNSCLACTCTSKHFDSVFTYICLFQYQSGQKFLHHPPFQVAVEASFLTCLAIHLSFLLCFQPAHLMIRSKTNANNVVAEKNKLTCTSFLNYHG